MNIFKKKNYLKRIDFINLVDSDKICKKSMTLSEIKELLTYLENEISKYSFDIDKNFIMNARRKYLKVRIEENLLKNEGNNIELILEELFNFWEFVNDDYFGDYSSSSRELGLSIQELIKKDDEYRKKGIISSQEKDVILEILREIKKHINDGDNL